MADADDPYRFDPLPVDELANEFADYDGHWWLMGGEALDLFLGRPTREHGDVDVEVLRGDAPRVHAYLTGRGWQVHFAYSGQLVEWDGHAPVPPDCFGVWCRRRASAPWAFDTKLAAADGEDWVYRRDARIRRPLATMVRHTAQGVPYIAPEVQLLFKAKDTRPKDEADFDNVVPALDADAVRWLAEALAVAHPDHPWCEALYGRP